MPFCGHCGSALAEGAGFCPSCGSPVSTQPFSPTAVQQSGGVDFSKPTSFFTIETGREEHKHAGLDLFFKDSEGRVLLVARDQSPIGLRHSYMLVDCNEVPRGYIETTGGPIHFSVAAQDLAHNIQGYVRIGGSSPRGTLPPCSIEDANGGMLGTVVGSLLSLSVMRQDGSRIFDASMGTAGGMMATLSAIAHKAFRINVYDPTFPQPMLVAVFAALNSST